MKRYFVEQVKRGITEGGMACGPVSGDVIVTIQFRKNDEESKWITNIESMGYANIYLNDEDPFEIFMKADVNDLDYGEMQYKGQISEFEGIEFNDYEDMFEAIAMKANDPVVDILRYLIAITRCSANEVDAMIKLAVGKYLDEVDIPISDIEEEYLDEIDD